MDQLSHALHITRWVWVCKTRHANIPAERDERVAQAAQLEHFMKCIFPHREPMAYVDSRSNMNVTILQNHVIKLLTVFGEMWDISEKCWRNAPYLPYDAI